MVTTAFALPYVLGMSKVHQLDMLSLNKYTIRFVSFLKTFICKYFDLFNRFNYARIKERNLEHNSNWNNDTNAVLILIRSSAKYPFNQWYKQNITRSVAYCITVSKCIGIKPT